MLQEAVKNIVGMSHRKWDKPTWKKYQKALADLAELENKLGIAK